MRWLVVLLLLVNIVFFSLMQWGGKLAGEEKNSQALAALNPEKMKLISSPPVAPSPVAPPAPVVPVAPVAPVAPAPIVASAPLAVAVTRAAENSCMEWGEFSGTDLARADKALAQMKLGDKLTQRSVEYTRGYWVYLPPLKKHASRVKKIQQLKELGVEDYFVVQEPGRWMNAISLGVFKTEEAARHFQAELSKKGVKSAQIGERASKLKFTVFVLKHVDAAALAQVTAWQKDYAGSELKTVTCE